MNTTMVAKLKHLTLQASPLRPALMLLVVGLAGCTASATVGPTNTTTTTGCSTDSAVVCSSGTGYSCDGSSQPEDSDTTLICSADQGTGDFCCYAGGGCSYDATETGCVTGAVGYSCTSGAPAPDATDSTLVCSVPTSTAGNDEYCCYTNTTTAPSGATCQQDTSIQGCQPDATGNPSYGFSCTGTDTPDQDFSGITCSTPETSTGVNDYCCTYQ